jgi:hypothetical protein
MSHDLLQLFRNMPPLLGRFWTVTEAVF